MKFKSHRTLVVIQFLVLVLLTLTLVAKVALGAELPTLYLHRTIVSGVSPEGRLMDDIPPIGEHVTLNVSTGESFYWYTMGFQNGTLESGWWEFELWYTGGGLTLDAYVDLVSNNGTILRSALAAGYGFFLVQEDIPTEATIGPMFQANNVNVSFGDRVRLRWDFSVLGSLVIYYDGVDYVTKGGCGNESPPIPEFPLGVEAAAGIGLTVAVVYIWLRKRKPKPTVAKRFTTKTSNLDSC